MNGHQGMWAKPTVQPVTSAPNADPLSPTVLSRQRSPGRRFAQVVKLKPEFREQYKEVHKKVWPEVLQQIKGCNITDYSIFYDADSGYLFASFKYVGHAYADDMERMRENPKVREWWKMTDGWQESVVPGATSSEAAGAGEPSWWKPLEEVFYNP